MPAPGIDAPRIVRVRSALIPLVAGVVLQLPEPLLAEHDLGGLAERIDDAALALSVLGALLVGGAGAALFLLTRARGRGATALGAAAALGIVLGGLLLANAAPPPFIGAYAPAGEPSLLSTLSTGCTVLVVGAGAAALVLTVRHLQQTLASGAGSR